MAEPMKIELRVDKQCKNSVRYASSDDKAPIKTIYVDRSAWGGAMPDVVIVTLDKK